MLIDTHAHLDYPDYQQDLDEVLARAANEGVTRVITIGTGLESSARAIAIAEKYPQVYAVVGVHPTNVLEEEADFLPALRDLASHPKVAAIGETGLDYHRLPSEALQSSPAIAALQAESPDDAQAAVMDGAYKSAQADAFRMQLDLAVELGLNVVIHQRDAWDDTLDILKPYTGKVRGVYHCFGNFPDQAREILALGHLVSFTGIVTFKNAGLAGECAATLPLDSFMVETDCPYLAPVPFRGKRCEPAHTRLVAEKIAASRGISVQDLASATTQTAEGFFRLQ
ncbi:TatD family deoxyribonuclease [Spartobacteria bacterium LR76]|nr:TatD family deoxyribonuclease [Spartobacteria bacterium LR76]